MKLQQAKSRAVRLTERDEEIISFINKFGVCEMPQIRSQFKMGRATCYHVLKRLVDAGHLIHRRIYYNRHGSYQICKTAKGATNEVPLEIYNHQIMVLKIFQRLIEAHPNAEVISERELIAEKFEDGIGKNGHLSDGLVILEDKCIAIEVELSKKAKGRLKKIIEQYLTNSDIHEVWYFCAPEILKRTREVAANIDMIKVIHIEEFLND